MKKICLIVLLLLSLCVLCEAKTTIRRNQPAVQPPSKFEQSASLTGEPEKQPYFTGFNGYAWGTSMDIIMSFAKPETRIAPGFLNADIYSSFKAETAETLKKRSGIAGIKTWIRGAGFAIRPGFEYYGAAYGKKDGKYPYVIYVAKNGRLVAGAFAYSWRGEMPPRLAESRDRIYKILAYVEANYPDAQKTVTPRHNAFNAVLEYDALLKARDAAGGIIININEGVGLRKNAPDLLQILLMSSEYLALTGQDQPPQPMQAPTL